MSYNAETADDLLLEMSDADLVAITGQRPASRQAAIDALAAQVEADFGERPGACALMRAVDTLLAYQVISLAEDIPA